MDRRPAAYDAAEAVAISAAEVPPREGQTSDDAIAHGGERFRFALSVVGNTVGGAVLLAGAFALPSVFATLASLLIA